MRACLFALTLTLLAGPAAHALEPDIVVAKDLLIGDQTKPVMLTVKGVEEYLSREFRSNLGYTERHVQLDKIFFSLATTLKPFGIGMDHLVGRPDLLDHDKRDLMKRIDFTVLTHEGAEKWSCTLDIDPKMDLLNLHMCAGPHHSNARRVDDFNLNELFPGFVLSDYVTAQ